QDRLDLLTAEKRFDHVTATLEDREALEGAWEKFRPDVVIHLAAQAGVRYSIDHPDTYIQSNIVGTFNLLEVARKLPPRHLMLASTSSVYGGNTKIPFAEVDRADGPVSLYAATKKATEALAHSSAHLWGIPTTAFRFFTVYGPWGRPDMALFKFVQAIERGEPIDVYGHGLMRRDFTYVDDIVEGIVALSDAAPIAGNPVSERDSLSAVAPFRTVNIAGGAPTGLLDFIEAIESEMGKPAERRMLPMQQGDVVETFADPSLLRDLVGVIPATDIRTGIAEFVRWYRSYFGNR
ncbi:NAD-dependent epimerase/dehydratase family protein, partial [Microbacterium azadirachtae]|uniref:NAD-dependent epimerase/dehydratase family protein n=1 Tax=Microbacterium azadirachtae TaxID=582680 RepID=UPI003F74D680